MKENLQLGADNIHCLCGPACEANLDAIQIDGKVYLHTRIMQNTQPLANYPSS